MGRNRPIASIRDMIIRNSILLTLTVTITVTFVGSVLYYQSLEAQTNLMKMQTLNAVADKLETALSQIEYRSASMVSSQQLCRHLLSGQSLSTKSGQSELLDQYLYQKEVYKLLNDLRGLTSLSAVGIYYYDGSSPQYFNNIMRHDLYDLYPVEEAVEAVSRQNDAVKWVSVFSPGYDRRMFALVRNICSPDTLLPFGALALLVETTYLESYLPSAYSDAGDNRAFYLVDASGSVIVTNDRLPSDTLPDIGILKDDEGIRPIGNGKHMLYTTLNHMGWKMVELSGTGTLWEILFKTIMVQPLVALLCLMLAAFLARKQAAKIDRPLQNIVSAMKHIEDGKLLECVPDNAFVETNRLAVSMNAMVNRLQRSRQLIYEKEIRQKEAEFHSLQSQINPHFFYNTLETINLLLLVEDKIELSNLVVNLADILRFNISNKATIITVREEMDLVTKYLQIMQARFSDRLKCEMNCTEEALDCPIIKLLIQPLVENAVKHGLENLAGACVISIRAYIDGDKLFVYVEDNGIGIDPVIAAAIMDGTYCPDGGRHNGVGIQNIIQRISMYYGCGYGVSIAQRPCSGTQVILCIPYQKNLLSGKEENHANPVD